MKARLSQWKAPLPRYKTGVMAKYAKLVSSASEGAVTRLIFSKRKTTGST